MILKPCAHCGNDRPEFVDKPGEVGRFVAVICRRCGISTARHYYHEPEAREAVVRGLRFVWDRRQHEPAEG